MADRKTGSVVYREALSPLLEIFRLMPQADTPFPEYRAGQYIALSRPNCKLTKKVAGPDGGFTYIYDLDEAGNIRLGPVTHSYSISSAPAETREKGYLEFYVVLEMIRLETPGRLSESLFHVDPNSDREVTYMNKITGDFTLEKRAAGYENVVMVGTGTGAAPFASMIKQLAHDAAGGRRHPARFTFFHANRTFRELGYHREFCDIEASGAFDFVYVPSVSRPIRRDFEDRALGVGRANNMLRMVFEMPLREQEDLKETIASGGEITRAQQRLQRAIFPELPQKLVREALQARMDPPKTVILTCGNPGVMDDIRTIAERNRIRFEKEEW